MQKDKREDVHFGVESRPPASPSVFLSDTALPLVMLPVAFACGSINGFLLGQLIADCHILRNIHRGQITFAFLVNSITATSPAATFRLGGFGAIVGLVYWIVTRPRTYRRVAIILIAGFLAMLFPMGCCGYFSQFVNW